MGDLNILGHHSACQTFLFFLSMKPIFYKKILNFYLDLVTILSVIWALSHFRCGYLSLRWKFYEDYCTSSILQKMS